MKIYLLALLCVLMTICNVARCQQLDTLIDVGGYRLHFNVIKGNGVPILFESGGGNDGTIWQNILKPIAEVTGTTLITYDRVGLGKSDLDTTKLSIVSGIEGLETGLKNLGYSGDIMIVAHSVGGFYSTLLASRNPQKVKAAVLIDANHVCFFTDEQVTKILSKKTDRIERLKNLAFKNMIDVMRTVAFPLSIPVVDMVAERTLFEGTPDADRWKTCHKQFVETSNNRQEIVANDCGHYIFFGNAELVVDVIVKQYANLFDNASRLQVLQRGFEYAITSVNEIKRKETKYRHSENDLNEWGYKLLQQGKIQIAVEVFKLNVSLNPESANVFDSLAECYEVTGDKALAILNYKHAIELDPKKKHSMERLKALNVK